LSSNIFSNEIESSIISGVMKNGEIFSTIIDICNPDDFYWKPFKWVYDCFVVLYDRGLVIDFLTVSEELSRTSALENFHFQGSKLKGLDALKEIYSKDVNRDSIESYAAQCHDYSAKRKLKKLFEDGAKRIEGGDTSIEVATKTEFELGKISTFSGINTALISSSDTVLDKAILQTELASKGNTKYIETGIKSLDNMIGGFFPQQLITIGGLRGDGKSALAKTIALNISTLNTWKKKVGIFTLEMSNEQYMQRMISALCGIPPLRLKMGKIYENEWESYNRAIEVIRGSKNLHFDDTPHMTSVMLKRKISKMKELGVDLVILDQLSLMAQEGSRGEPEYSRIDKLSYQFKTFAREFDISFLNIQQMSRSIESYQRRDKEPQSSDLSNAGDAAPDLVILIQHQKDKKIITSSKLWVVKQRDGAVGGIDVKFDGERTHFRDLTPEEKVYTQSQSIPEFVQDKVNE
jgi:replicative DNA helicase